jgi:hypothetical protein
MWDESIFVNKKESTPLITTSAAKFAERTKTFLRAEGTIMKAGAIFVKANARSVKAKQLFVNADARI